MQIKRGVMTRGKLQVQRTEHSTGTKLAGVPFVIDCKSNGWEGGGDFSIFLLHRNVLCL